MAPYLDTLGQSLVQTLVASAHVPKSALWGERSMLDMPLQMALDWPSVEVPKLMFVSSLGKALDYGSDVLAEYEARSRQLLKNAAGTLSVATRLEPLVLAAFKRQDELDAYRGRPDAERDPAYLTWLDRVAQV